MQSLENNSVDNIFRFIFVNIQSAINRRVKWTGPDGGVERFIRLLRKEESGIKKIYGNNWKIAILIDELDNLEEMSKIEAAKFYSQLRSLLDASNFSRNICVVACGARGMEKLVTYGSPLNILRTIYLTKLSEKNLSDLMLAGIPREACELLHNDMYKLTGGHPFIAQGLLENIWTQSHNTQTNFSVAQILPETINKFLIEHNDFDMWAKGFMKLEHQVYTSLIKASINGLTAQDLVHLFNKNNTNTAIDIEKSIQILCCHGLVAKSRDTNRFYVSGNLFVEWYKQTSYYITVFDDITKNMPFTQNSGKKVSVKIFISHSKKDEIFVKEIRNLLMQSLAINHLEIRCTSLAGHRLDHGTEVTDQIRLDLQECEIFFSVITKNSLRSKFVLFELGAAWALQKKIIPITGPGASFQNMPLLLSNTHALGYCDKDGWHQLIKNISLTLSVNTNDPTYYNSTIESIAKFGSP